MIKEELRRSGGDMQQAADQYVDTVVTNAVMNVRGRLDVRQRDASKTFFVLSNDPTGHLNDNLSNDPTGHVNDNRSNRSASNKPERLSNKLKKKMQLKPRRIKYDDCSERKGEEDDEGCDVDDDDSVSVGPSYDVKTRSDSQVTGLSRSVSQCNEEASCRYASVDEARSTGAPSRDALGGTDNRDGRCQKCGRKCDCEQKSESCRSKDSSVECSQSQSSENRRKKDDGQTPRSCERKRTRDRDASRKTNDDDSRRSCDCDCDATSTREDDEEEGDVVRCLQRRDDESVDSYLVRSILALGSLANQTNSSAGRATGNTVVEQALIETLESIARDRSPREQQQQPPCQTCTEQCRYCNPTDSNRTVYHGGTHDKTPFRDWVSTPLQTRNRFASTLGNRYSGFRSAGAGRVRATVSGSSSSNAIQLPPDSSVEDGRSPPPPRQWSGDWNASHHVHSYRSNRGDRERFSGRSSRCGSWTGGNNYNMHANNDDDGVTTSADDKTKLLQPPQDSGSSRVTAGDNTIELNRNNSRRDDNNACSSGSSLTQSSDDCSAVSSRTKPGVSGVAERSSSGTAKPTNNDNNTCAHNNTGDNYYTVTAPSPAECWVIGGLDDPNNNNNNVAAGWTRNRDSGCRQSRPPSRRSRRSCAALRAVSSCVMEADALLRQLDSEQLQPDVDLLVRVLDEYREVLGPGGDRPQDLWPAARRLAALPAGRWIVGEVLEHAQESLSKFQTVKPSEFCRRAGLSELGLALQGGVDDRLTSRLVDCMSMELERVVIQHAVSSVAQALVNMTSLLRHCHQHQSVCQYFSTINVRNTISKRL